MKGMCHLCHASGVELKLTPVKETVNNPTGVVTIPICNKCRE